MSSTPIDPSVETFPHVPLETGVVDDGLTDTGPEAGLWRDAWRQLVRNPSFILGATIITLYLFVALFPQVLATQGIGRELCDTAAGAQPPSSEFIFGLDEKGCPYFPRVVYGARPSMIIGPSVTLFAVAIGLSFGTLAGYYGGLTDSIVGRFADVVLALPGVLAALVFITAFRNVTPETEDAFIGLRWLSRVFIAVDDFTGVRGVGLVVFMLTMLGWPAMLRLARSSTLSNKNADYVDAARALGASNRRIMRRHVVPNSLAPVLAYGAITMGAAIVAEAALTFLGVGLQQPTVSWGLQLSVAQARIQNDPHLMVFPGIFLALLVLSFILVGDALRDALDPKLR